MKSKMESGKENLKEGRSDAGLSEVELNQWLNEKSAMVEQQKEEIRALRQFIDDVKNNKQYMEEEDAKNRREKLTRLKQQ